jgi:putative transposase
LGDSDFVLTVLSQANEQFERRYELKRLGYDMSRVADMVARTYSIDKDDLFLQGRQRLRSDARGLFCYWCFAELGLSLTDLARKLEMTVSGVGYAVRRGEKIVKHHQYRLIDQNS